MSGSDSPTRGCWSPIVNGRLRRRRWYPTAKPAWLSPTTSVPIGSLVIWQDVTGIMRFAPSDGLPKLRPGAGVGIPAQMATPSRMPSTFVVERPRVAPMPLAAFGSTALDNDCSRLLGSPRVRWSSSESFRVRRYTAVLYLASYLHNQTRCIGADRGKRVMRGRVATYPLHGTRSAWRGARCRLPCRL
jgi:hypothetical protein